MATNGPLFVGANGRVASTNHIGYFQYGPAGAVQLEPLLAPGGNPVAGANTIKSYDSGHRTWQEVIRESGSNCWLEV